MNDQLEFANLQPNNIRYCAYCNKASIGQFTTASWVKELCAEHATQIARTLHALEQQFRLSYYYKDLVVDAIVNGSPVAYSPSPMVGAVAMEDQTIWQENHHVIDTRNPQPIIATSDNAGRSKQFQPPKGLGRARRVIEKARSETTNVPVTEPVTEITSPITGPGRMDVTQQETARILPPRETTRDTNRSSQVTDRTIPGSVISDRLTDYMERIKNPPRYCECGCGEVITSSDPRKTTINNTHRQRLFQKKKREKRIAKAKEFARQQNTHNTQIVEKQGTKKPSITRKYFT